MAINITGKFKPQGNFALMDAEDIELPDGTRLNEYRAVKTINGVEPDESGNIELVLEEDDADAEGISVFDLGAMGLSSLTVPAGMAMLAADTSEILAALSAGAVRFVIPFTVGDNAGAFQADMHGFTDGTGAYQCVCMAMMDVPVVVMVLVSTEGLQVSVVPVASVIGLPMVTDTDNGKFMQVVDGAWAAVSLQDVSEVGE